LIPIAPAAFSKGKLQVTWDESSSGTELDPDRYRLLFDEGFNSSSLNGPKIFAPIHTSFGASTFDGASGKAYQVIDGNLILKAYKGNGKWRSGSVQTANLGQSLGRQKFDGSMGFACQGCYFETRLRFPAGI